MNNESFDSRLLRDRCAKDDKKSKFIFQIGTEPGFLVLVKIMSAFQRRGISFVEMYTNFNTGDDRQQLMISVFETKDCIGKMCKRLERETDIVNVQVFEEEESLKGEGKLGMKNKK